MARMKITQDEENPVPTEILAQSVLDITKGIKRLNSTPLNRETIEVLVSASSKVAKRTVSRVLDHLFNLEENYIKKGAKR